MRIAVHASHTIDEKGCPGCVAIKNEAIEARIIVEKMLQVAATYDNVELIDCSVNYADSYTEYIDESAKRINDANPDFVVSIGFSSSMFHTPSMRSDIYLKHPTANWTSEYDPTAYKLATYMRIAGFTPSIESANQFALVDKVDCPTMMIFDVCPIDTVKAMKLYENTPVFEYLLLAITANIPHHGWYTRDGIGIQYIDEDARKSCDGKIFSTGITTIGENDYLFDEQGYLMHSGLIELDAMKWVYADIYTGRLAKSEWIADNMNVYYADDDHFLVLPSADNMNELPARTIDGIEYTFDKTGCVQNELHRLNGTCKIQFFRAEDGSVHPYIAPVEAIKSIYDPTRRS